MDQMNDKNTTRKLNPFMCCDQVHQFLKRLAQNRIKCIAQLTQLAQNGIKCIAHTQLAQN